jgi:hypothetical protein
VLLTHKKPEPKVNKAQSSATLPRRQVQVNNSKAKLAAMDGDDENEHGEDQALWAVGEVSDVEGEDEDVDHYQNPLPQQEEFHHKARVAKRQAETADSSQRSSEEQGLISSGRCSRGST